MKFMDYVKISKIIEEKLHQIDFFGYYLTKRSNSSLTLSLEFKDGEKLEMEVHTLSRAYPADVEILASRKKPPFVIVAPYISERTSSICRKLGISYFDYAGNCLFVAHNIYIYESGHKNKEAIKSKARSPFDRDSWVSSLVLRELYLDVNKIQKVSHLSKKTGVSLGQVSKVINYLLDHAYMKRVEGGYLLVDPENLAKDWAQIYNQKRLEPIKAYSLESLAVIEKKIGESHKDGLKAYLSHHSAAMRYSPSVRYNQASAYVAFEDIEVLKARLDIKEVDSGPNLLIYPLQNDSYIVDARIIGEEQLLSPVQTYLDLFSSGGRGEEEAEIILRKEILK